MCGSAAPGIFFIVAYNVLAAIFRGLGDSKSPLVFVAVACAINVVGDLVLVAGFHMDAAGAAIATVAAPGCQRNICSGAVKKEESSFPDQKRGFSF